MAEYTGKSWGQKVAEYTEVRIKDLLGEESVGVVVETGKDYVIVKYHWKQADEKDVLYYAKGLVGITPCA